VGGVGGPGLLKGICKGGGEAWGRRSFIGVWRWVLCVGL